MAIEYDKVRGASLEFGNGGYKGTRVALVTGITATGSDRLGMAVQMVLADTPIGSPFPGTGSFRVPLTTLRAEPYGDHSPGQFLVTMMYEVPTGDAPLPGLGGEARLAIGGTVEMETTQYYIEEVVFTGTEIESFLQ